LLITFPAVCRSVPCCPPYTSLLSAINCRADRRTLTDTTKAHRHTNTQILFINTPKLSSISPKVFCITPKVLKNALAAFFLSRLVLFSQFFRLSALYFKIIAYICTCNPKGKQRHIARFRTLVHIVQIYRAKL
jgi:hypothetical protein